MVSAQLHNTNEACPGVFCKIRGQLSPVQASAGTPLVPPTGTNGKEGGDGAGERQEEERKA